MYTQCQYLQKLNKRYMSTYDEFTHLNNENLLLLQQINEIKKDNILLEKLTVTESNKNIDNKCQYIDKDILVWNNEYNYPPLMTAIKNNDFIVAKLLLKYTKNINLYDIDGNSIIDIILSYNKYDNDQFEALQSIVKSFIENKTIEINKLYNGQTILNICIKHHWVDCIQLILDINTKIDMT